MIIPDQFSLAMSRGYYFDRCIDLVFYDSDGNKIYDIKTPERGIKPSITVKGSFIIGSYTISTFVSIQNMSYSLDIQKVSLIEVRPYYSGMREAWDSGGNLSTTSGNSMMLQVLYADQEKEPPNRAVRFQCSVASECKSLFDVPIYVGVNDVVLADDKTTAADEGSGTDKGAAAHKTTMGNLLTELAKLRNSFINSPKAPFSGVPAKSALIKKIVSTDAIYNMEVAVAPGTYRFGELLRLLSSYSFSNRSKEEYADIEIGVYRDSILARPIPPADWEDRAERFGYKTDDKKMEFYKKYYAGEKNERLVDGSGNMSGSFKGLGSSPDNPIPLNFVVAAYRSEVVAHIEMMYDDRIYPGCWVKIKSRAIMGKAGSSGGKKLYSRIYGLNDYSIFEVPARVQFEFSTTENSVMKFEAVLHGEIVESQSAGGQSAS